MTQAINPNTDFIYIKVHGMPCTNQCKHCYFNGSPGKPMMKYETILFILDAALKIKEKYPAVLIQYFDEPTIHPDFSNIINTQSKMDLLWPDFFLPTNGYGLARMDEVDWKMLKKVGMNELQLTFYGLGSVHDEFAGRTGAYQDLVTVLQKANRYGLRWTAGVVFHTGLNGTLNSTMEELRVIGDHKGTIGWFIPNYQGRGINDSWRPTPEDLMDVPNISTVAEFWKSEMEHIEIINKSKHLMSRSGLLAWMGPCHGISLEVKPDLNVYLGGGCDSSPAAEIYPYLKLGNLENSDFDSLLADYCRNSLPPLKLLEEITWGELADRYGDRHDRHVYSQQDLVGNKWATLYLRDRLGGSPKPIQAA